MRAQSRALGFCGVRRFFVGVNKMEALIPDLQKIVYGYLMDFCICEIQGFDKNEFHCKNLVRMNQFQKQITHEMAKQWYIDLRDSCNEFPTVDKLFENLLFENVLNDLSTCLQCRPFCPGDWDL